MFYLCPKVHLWIVVIGKNSCLLSCLVLILYRIAPWPCSFFPEKFNPPTFMRARRLLLQRLELLVSSTAQKSEGMCAASANTCIKTRLKNKLIPLYSVFLNKA